MLGQTFASVSSEGNSPLARKLKQIEAELAKSIYTRNGIATVTHNGDQEAYLEIQVDNPSSRELVYYSFPLLILDNMAVEPIENIAVKVPTLGGLFTTHPLFEAGNDPELPKALRNYIDIDAALTNNRVQTPQYERRAASCSL